MYDEEMEEPSSGLDTLRSSISSAIRRGGPLSEVLKQRIESGYEPMPESYAEKERRLAPAKSTRYRDELMSQLEEAKQKLLTPKPEPKTLLEKLSRQFVMPTGKSGDLLIARQERAEKEAQDEMKRRETILNLVAKQAEMEREQEIDLATRRREEAEEQRRIAESSKPKNLQADAQKIIDLQSIVDSTDPSVSQSAKDAAAREIASIGRKNSPEDRSILGQLVRANQMLNSKNPQEVQAAQSFIARYSGSGKPPVTVPQARTDLMIKRAKEFLATIDEKERAAAFANPYPNERQQKIREAVRLAGQPTYEEVSKSGGFSVEPLPDEDEG